MGETSVRPTMKLSERDAIQQDIGLQIPVSHTKPEGAQGVHIRQVKFRTARNCDSEFGKGLCPDCPWEHAYHI